MKKNEKKISEKYDKEKKGKLRTSFAATLSTKMPSQSFSTVHNLTVQEQRSCSLFFPPKHETD